MSKFFRGMVAAGALALTCSAAMAADLVYTPVNPTFGGNPLNSSHLLSIASAQKTATTKTPVTPSTGSGPDGTGTTAQSYADLFVQQLQGRLLSALASQVTDAIFGQNPQDHGTVTFGDTTVVFDRQPDAINLTITDNLTGTVTQISVPQLVTSSN